MARAVATAVATRALSARCAPPIKASHAPPASAGPHCPTIAARCTDRLHHRLRRARRAGAADQGPRRPRCPDRVPDPVGNAARLPARPRRARPRQDRQRQDHRLRPAHRRPPRRQRPPPRIRPAARPRPRSHPRAGQPGHDLVEATGGSHVAARRDRLRRRRPGTAGLRACATVSTSSSPAPAASKT